jgi:hypothetical protein
MAAAAAVAIAEGQDGTTAFARVHDKTVLLPTPQLECNKGRKTFELTSRCKQSYCIEHPPSSRGSAPTACFQ